MKNISSRLGSRLLRPILIAVVLIILFQVVTLLFLTRSSVTDLVDQVVTTMNDSGEQMNTQLDQANSKVGQAITKMSLDSGNALTATLNQQLSAEQQQVEKLLVESVQNTANELAKLMAIAAPDAIWDKDTPALTQLVRNLHRNPQVIFARYFDSDGKPLTRHLDKRIPKVKELIKKGKGRGSMNKAIDAARKDPEIYLVEVDINPRGAVIGKFMLAVSNKQAQDAAHALKGRFETLVNSTRSSVEQVINTEAENAQGQLKASISSTMEMKETAKNQTHDVIERSSEELINDLTLALIATGLLMIAILAALMTARITSKLNSLTDELEDLAAGEGDLTRRIDLNSDDEIGDMSTAINQFIEKTQRIVQQATQATEETVEQINTINSVSSEANSAVDRQNTQLHQVSAAMSQMTDTTNQVAERIQLNLANVDEIRQSGQEASSISSSVKNNISQLSQEVQGAANVINGVADQSNQITAILDVIKGIAEQTNLLALNAAIEAARAGDTGRGFAVVADEVRDLASKTQASTEDIQRQIDELQSGVKTAVQVINDASNNAETSISSISSSDERIQNISESVERLYDFTNEIAAMAEEQSQVSSEVNSNIENISNEARVTSESMSSNASSAATLGELAQSLKRTLAQFRV